MNDDKWQQRAACADPFVDPEMFFDKNRVAEAQAVCARCPVIAECRQFSRWASDGVWAGEPKTDSSGPSTTAPFLEQHGTTDGYSRHVRRGEKPCTRCLIAINFSRNESKARVAV